jgi:Carboxypeptidase regulatory-like domain
MRKAIALGLAAMMVLWMPAGSLAAGAARGAISGTARDSAGARLVNVGVRVRNANRGDVVLQTRTGAAGQFPAPSLEPGVYIIEALGSSGQVIGVSPTMSVMAGQTATATVTPSAAQSPQALSQAGFSLFGLGTAASVGIVAAADVAAVTTIAVVTNDSPTPSPSQ